MRHRKRSKSAGRTTTQAGVPYSPKAKALVREIARRLQECHGSPRLGNPNDPLDDLIFVLLSGRTSPHLHAEAYGQLKSAYPSWDAAMVAEPQAVYEHISRAGLGRKRTRQIRELLARLREEHGEARLDFLGELDDKSVERTLLALPGVGIKTARCVMLYALERRTFPVDVHVRRILSYFGLVHPAVRLEYAQDPLQRLVAPELRYSLHVNLVAHGRTICRPQAPRCEICPLEDLCPASHLRTAASSTGSRSLHRLIKTEHTDAHRRSSKKAPGGVIQVGRQRASQS